MELFFHKDDGQFCPYLVSWFGSSGGWRARKLFVQIGTNHTTSLEVFLCWGSWAFSGWDQNFFLGGFAIFFQVFAQPPTRFSRSGPVFPCFSGAVGTLPGAYSIAPQTTANLQLVSKQWNRSCETDHKFPLQTVEAHFLWFSQFRVGANSTQNLWCNRIDSMPLGHIRLHRKFRVKFAPTQNWLNHQEWASTVCSGNLQSVSDGAVGLLAHQPQICGCLR